MDESCVHSEECGLDYCSYDVECPFYEEGKNGEIEVELPADAERNG